MNLSNEMSQMMPNQSDALAALRSLLSKAMSRVADAARLHIAPNVEGIVIGLVDGLVEDLLHPENLGIRSLLAKELLTQVAELEAELAKACELLASIKMHHPHLVPDSIVRIVEGKSTHEPT